LEENDILRTQYQFISIQTINEKIFLEFYYLNISYSLESKNSILLKILQLFKKIISSSFPKQSKIQNKIEFSQFEDMINKQINERKETLKLFKNTLFQYFGVETGTENEIISKYDNKFKNIQQFL
jgi:hypothetical protein